MAKRGGKLAVLGLLLGVGLGFVIVNTQRYLATEVVALLEEEAVAACNCRFEAEDVSISLLTLTARARNAKVTDPNGTSLAFKKIVAHISPFKIFNRIVVISKLRLIDGFADGLSEDSALFKFIDHLTEPIPPELDRPDRLRVELDRLTVEDARLREPFTTTSFWANGSWMTMTRNPDDSYTLLPKIEQLNVVTSQGSKYIIGDCTGEVTIRDGQIDYQKVLVTLGNAKVEAKARSLSDEGNKLEGTAALSVDAPFLKLEDWLTTTLVGQAELSGTLAMPKVKGRLELPPNGRSNVQIAGIEIISIDQNSADFAFERSAGSYRLDVTNLAGASSTGGVKTVRPFSIDNDNLNGSFAVSAQSVSVGTLTANDINGEVAISGSLGAPVLSARGKVGELHYLGAVARNSDFSIVRGTPERTTIEVKHDSLNYGSLAVNTVLKIPDEGPVEFAPLAVVMERFVPYPPPADTAPSIATPRVTGTISLNGPIDGTKLSGSGKFSVAAPSYASGTELQGELVVGAGNLALTVNSSHGDLKAVLNQKLSSNGTGELKLTASNLSPREYFSTIECGTISGTTDYTYSSNNPFLGKGTLALSELRFGCSPFEIAIASPIKLPIEDGIIGVKRLDLLGDQTQIALAGSISLLKGYDLSVDGNFELNSLVGMFPAVDDLVGKANTKLSLSGDLGLPTIVGSVNIKDGGFSVESTNLSGDRISMTLNLAEKALSIDSGSGSLNQGGFKLSGSIAPLNFEESDLNLEIDHVVIEPYPNVSMELAGALNLARSEIGRPTISGELTIESGQFERDFDLSALLGAIQSSISGALRTQNATASLPEIDLAIQLRGSRNFFILSNLMQAELSSSLALGGTLREPQLSGRMDTINGWLGFQDRRFELSSGNISFDPSQPEPVIKATGEATIRSRGGEFVLVFIDVSGPISFPRTALSTDSGLGHQETLALLSSSGTLVAADFSTMVNRVGGDLDRSTSPLFDEETSIRSFLKSLTELDAASIEPALDPTTGLVEPTIIARKQITNRLALKGTSALSSSQNRSEIGLLYNVTPKVNVEGSIETASTDQTASLGLDLTYTILAQSNDSLKIDFLGNDAFHPATILAAIRVSGDSRIATTDLSRVEQEIRQFYASRGFHNAKVLATCELADDFCRQLMIKIDENEETLITEIRLEGDQLPPTIRDSLLSDLELGAPATQVVIEDSVQQTLRDLRNEGFIGARVTAEYLEIPASLNRILSINVNLGHPVTFVFNGNTAFDAEEFLDTINLFERKQPFGGNTIETLIENIERLYRENGYLYVAISYTKELDPESSRVVYSINVVEDLKIKVGKVRISGPLTKATIVERVKSLFPDRYAELFKPEYAVTEVIDENALVITEIYRLAGYPKAVVTGQIVPKGGKVEIEYRVASGEIELIDSFELIGWPSDLPSIAAPKTPLSTTEADRYPNQLKEALNQAGYLTPGILSEYSAANKLFRITLTPNTRTTIRSITIQGTTRIEVANIRDKIDLQPGEPWNVVRFAEVQKRLLQLGLFSRVRLQPADGELNEPEEDLLITLSERTLRTLEVGGGANSVLGAHIFGEATDREFFSDGRTLAFRLDTYYDPSTSDISQGIASLRYTNPSLANSPYLHSEDLRYQRLDNPTYSFDLDRIGLASGLQRTWEESLTSSLGHTLLFDNLDNVDPGAVLSDLDTGNVRLSIFSNNITYTQTDDPLLPRKGYKLELDSTFSTEAVGSEANYASVGGAASIIQPLPVMDERLSLAIGSHAAIARPFWNTDQIPITQRFYLGGAKTVRGFRENSLGPRGDDGAVIGGDFSVSSNLEVRYLLNNYISAHTFMDFGTVYLTDEPIDIDQIRRSAGFGMRALSPLGPIGFDIGAPLDERPGEPSVRFHFSVGSFF